MQMNGAELVLFKRAEWAIWTGTREKSQMSRAPSRELLHALSAFAIALVLRREDQSDRQPAQNCTAVMAELVFRCPVGWLTVYPLLLPQ